MTEKEFTPDQESKDKDYGFPFVEVQPIQGKSQEKVEPVPVSETASETPSEAVFVQEKEKVLEPEVVLPEAETISIPEQRIESAGIQHKAKEKKSSMPMVISLLFLIVLILAAMAYFLYLETGEPEEIVTEQVEEVQQEEVQEYGNVWESDEVEDQIEEELAPAEEVIPSGGLLTIINSRAGSPRYFVVISSLPSEESARKIAQPYLDRGVDLWMVFPFGENKNYRLAVGQFDDIEAASRAVENAKPTYGESIWILKY